MNKNLGTIDRVLRIFVGVMMIVGFFITPFALPFRLVMLGLSAYMLVSSLAGTCLGYRMMGMSTCSIPKH